MKEEKNQKKRSQHEVRFEEILKSYGFPKANATNFPPNENRRWTLDFVWLVKRDGANDAKVAVEIHGGYVGTVQKEMERNYEKMNWLTTQRWKVLHITPSMISDGSAFVYLYWLLRDVGGIVMKYNCKKGRCLNQNAKLEKFYKEWIKPEGTPE